MRTGTHHEAVDQPLDGVRHGGREHQRLPLPREQLEDPVDLGQEAHVEHVVRLVEHQVLDAVELERAPLQVVEEAAGGGHDDVRAPAQGADLRPILTPPIRHLAAASSHWSVAAAEESPGTPGSAGRSPAWGQDQGAEAAAVG
jgi:hypothetical protein